MQVKKYIELAEIFIKKRLSPDFSDHNGSCHDFDHTLRVVKHALDLCDELPAANREIVQLAALLHDAARPLEDASQGKIDHAAEGAKLAGEFLQSIACPPEYISAVTRCIAQHRYRSRSRRPDFLESQIIFDADKLDSLGAVGIARSFLFAGKVGARVHNTPDEALNNPPYSVEDTAYREYLVKLSKLPDAMLTDPGKRRAKELSGVMKAFFQQLDREIYG